jgi:hypothetical protein
MDGFMTMDSETTKGRAQDAKRARWMATNKLNEISAIPDFFHLPTRRNRNQKQPGCGSPPGGHDWLERKLKAAVH